MRLLKNATFAFVKERYFRVVDEVRHSRLGLKRDPRVWSVVRVFEALSLVILRQPTRFLYQSDLQTW